MSLARSVKQYLGVRAITPPDLKIATRDPTSSDKAYVRGTLWLNKTGLDVFMWPGSGNWITLSGGGGGGVINIINGDSGSITGATVTVFADQASINSGSSVQFVNSGTVSTFNVTDALGNTLIGNLAGNLTLAGVSNTGIGSDVLLNLTTGLENVAVGRGCLSGATSASANVGAGFNALNAVDTGTNNIGIGTSAGGNLNGNEFSCILLNSLGIGGQSNVLSIGTATGTGGQELNSAYIQGIYSNTQNPSGTVEYVTIDNTTGLLGVTTAGGSGLIPYTDEAISFLAVVNNGYFCTAALTVTLPAAPAQGEVITLGIETAGAVVIQAVGAQIIRLGSGASSAAGTATSTAIGSSIELVYRAASTTWFSISTEGSWTLA